jgi:hypothetical protein
MQTVKLKKLSHLDLPCEAVFVYFQDEARNLYVRESSFSSIFLHNHYDFVYLSDIYQNLMLCSKYKSDDTLFISVEDILITEVFNYTKLLYSSIINKDDDTYKLSSFCLNLLSELTFMYCNFC